MKNFLFLSIVGTFFLLHFEGAKVALFDVPVYFVEIGVIASMAALFFNSSFPRRRESSHHLLNSISPQTKFVSYSLKAREIWIPAFARMTKEKVGIFFLLVSVSSSIIAATSPSAICPLSHEGLLRALGIMKSWFVFPIVFGYIVFHASHTYFSREKLILAFLISFLPIPILSFLGWLFGSGMTYDGRLEGFFNSPNTLAMYLTSAVILSWYFFRTCTSHPLFIIYNLSFLILLFLTRSVSAWIAVGVGILVFEFFKAVIPTKAENPRLPAGRQLPLAKNNNSTNKVCSTFTESWWNPDSRLRGNDKKKTLIIKYGSLLLFIILLVFSQWNNPRFENFFDPDSRSSFASRLMIWESAGKMISDSPLFGIGPGNFGKCYLAYQRYFPPYLEWSVPEPHNIFLAFWLGSGFIGLCAFCFLLFRWFRTVFRRIQKEGDLLLLSLAVIMITILIHGFFDTPYWRLGLSYIFWVVFFLGIREKMINNKF